MVSDEVSRETTEKCIVISFKAAAFSVGAFESALASFLASKEKSKLTASKESHGKMTVQELLSKGQGATAVEVKKEDMKLFESIAKKYKVDYAKRVDKTQSPPIFYVFVRGKDLDVITQTFKEYMRKAEQRKAKKDPSLRENLEEKKKQVEEIKKSTSRTRVKRKKRMKKREKVL